MNYEITIFGSGISAKITSSLLAKSGFNVCLISDKDKNRLDKDTNLVTFLSSGSLNYLSIMFPKMQFLNQSPEIKTIKCELESLNDNKSQSIEFNSSKSENLGKIIKNSYLEDFLDREIRQLGNVHTINSNQLDIVENNLEGVKLKLNNNEYIDYNLENAIEDSLGNVYYITRHSTNDFDYDNNSRTSSEIHYLSVLNSNNN